MATSDRYGLAAIAKLLSEMEAIKPLDGKSIQPIIWSALSNYLSLGGDLKLVKGKWTFESQVCYGIFSDAICRALASEIPASEFIKPSLDDESTEPGVKLASSLAATIKDLAERRPFCKHINVVKILRLILEAVLVEVTSGRNAARIEARTAEMISLIDFEIKEVESLHTPNAHLMMQRFVFLRACFVNFKPMPTDLTSKQSIQDFLVDVNDFLVAFNLDDSFTLPAEFTNAFPAEVAGGLSTTALDKLFVSLAQTRPKLQACMEDLEWLIQASMMDLKCASSQN